MSTQAKRLDKLIADHGGGDADWKKITKIFCDEEAKRYDNQLTVINPLEEKFPRRIAAKVTGASVKWLDNWTSRGTIPKEEEKRKRYAHRRYSFFQIVGIATMVKMKRLSNMPPSSAQEIAQIVMGRGLEMLKGNCKDRLLLYVSILNGKHILNDNLLRPEAEDMYTEPYITIPVDSLFMNIWLRLSEALETNISFDLPQSTDEEEIPE